MTASTQDLRLGDFVQWVSGGVKQWSEARRLVHIEALNGALWGFCDGSLTGFPLTDLVRDI